MNIQYPDKSSEIYKTFTEYVNVQVKIISDWLTEKNIEYVWNNQINNHLYRLYIPCKDILLDFEPYPVNNINYNYIRINFNTDVIRLCEKLFPETVIDTSELHIWKLTRKAANHFLRDMGVAPVYSENVLRLAFVKDNIIYQCIILKDNKVITNVTRHNCSIPYGTYIMLRYLNESFGVSEIVIKENKDNSYVNTMYQLINTKIINVTCKKKIWWSPTKTNWHIDRNNINNYMPFYFTETITYLYH